MIRIKCKKCGTDYSFEDSEIEFECVGSDERSMGTENAYSAEIEYDCEKCGNSMRAQFDLWEYPIGAYNYSEYLSFGCTVLEEPNYWKYLQEEPEPDEDEQQ
ncbi:MAG: hypothetical protein QE487_06760 [Fluviicola sp.]|nr:hypothetical protein [Fluviicola sp.]